MWKSGKYTKDRFRPRVLICDEKSQVSNVLSKYLSSVGFNTDQVHDGYQCIDLAWSKHPDIILLDLDTPGVDANDTMIQLRKIGINIPVILFSTKNTLMPFDHDSAVLKKPFRPKEIAVVLETLLLETKKEKRFMPRRFKIQ